MRREAPYRTVTESTMITIHWCGLIVGTISATWLLLSFFLRRGVSRGDKVMFVLAVLIVGCLLLLPPAKPMPTVYYGGKNQYQWINQLNWDESENNRRQAAVALGEILREGGLQCRYLVVSVLATAGSDAKPAIPALKE